VGTISKEETMPDERTTTEKHAEHALRKAKDDAVDGLKEAEHNARAAAEKAKRTLAGDSMTTSEKAASSIKEAAHKAAAAGDKAKRELRDKLEK
jgi:hypothetical protein